MLKQRFLTAFFLVPLVVLAVLKLSTEYFQWLVAGVVLLAAWEWFSIIEMKSIFEKLLAFTTLVLATLTSQCYLDQKVIVIFAASLWLIIAFFIIVFAHKSLSTGILKILKTKVIAVIIAVITLVTFLQTTVSLHQISTTGPQLVLFVMVTVWLADIGGYFVGKRWGKHKLASIISPNKTWQGVYGGLALVSIWTIIGEVSGLNAHLPFINWLVLTIVTASFSIIGDLFESVFKRLYYVKDSGALLPGHGGVLDRTDSLLAAIPVFFVGMSLLGVR